MRRLVLALLAVSTLACSGLLPLGQDEDPTPPGTVDTTGDTTPPTTSDTTGDTTTTTTTTTEPSGGGFPAQYLAINAVFGWDKAAGEIVNPTLSGYEYVSKISIELYTQAFVDAGYDYDLTDEYCTVELYLTPGTPEGSYSGDSDPTAWATFEHSGRPADVDTNCGDADHDIGDLFNGEDVVDAVLSIPYEWAVGVGELALDDTSVSTVGGRIYNTEVLNGSVLYNDYWIIGFRIDPNTHEVLIQGGYGVQMTEPQMWNGTALGTGLYFTVSPYLVDLGDTF